MAINPHIASGAIEIFNLAIEAKPDYYPAYKGLGKAYMAMDEKEKAINNLQKAAQLMTKIKRFLCYWKS